MEPFIQPVLKFDLSFQEPVERAGLHQQKSFPVILAMSSSETLQQIDLYAVLGADPMAQLDQIEALFRELAIEAETSGDHSKVPQAVEAFKVLRDPQLRQQYDQLLSQQRAQDHQQQQIAALQAQQAQAQAQAQAQVQSQSQAEATSAQSELELAMQRIVEPEAIPAQATQELQTPVEQIAVSQPQIIPAVEEPVVEALTEPVVAAEPAQADVAEDKLSRSHLSMYRATKALPPKNFCLSLMS